MSSQSRASVSMTNTTSNIFCVWGGLCVPTHLIIDCWREAHPSPIAWIYAFSAKIELDITRARYIERDACQTETHWQLDRSARWRKGFHFDFEHKIFHSDILFFEICSITIARSENETIKAQVRKMETRAGFEISGSHCLNWSITMQESAIIRVVLWLSIQTMRAAYFAPWTRAFL